MNGGNIKPRFIGGYHITINHGKSLFICEQLIYPTGFPQTFVQAYFISIKIKRKFTP